MRDVDLNRWQSDYVNRGRDECARFLIRENFITNSSGVVFRRELYEVVGGVDEAMRLSSDWKFWASLLCISDVAYVAEQLNCFRTHARTVRSTTGVWDHLQETFAVMEYIAAKIELSEPQLADLHARVAVLFMFALTSEQPKPGDIKRALEGMSRLRFRFSARSSTGLARQTLQAIGARLDKRS